MKKFICFVLACCLILSISTICAFADNNEPSFIVSCSEIIDNKVTVTVTVDKTAMTYEGTWASAYFRISFGDAAQYFTADGVVGSSFPPTYNGITATGGTLAVYDYTYEGTSYRRYAITDMTGNTATLTETFSVSESIPNGDYSVTVLPSALYQESPALYTSTDDNADMYFWTQTPGSGFPPSPTNVVYYKTASITPAIITIGSGSGSTTTELEVGEGKDIVNNAGTAVVSGSVSGNTATLNVACDQACVVAYTTNNGATYTRLTATASGDAYDFSVAYTEGMQFVVAVKGDLDGDGEISPSEAAQVKAAQLGKLTTLTVLQSMAGDLDGDGVISPSEAAQVKAAQLGKLSLGW